MARKTSKPTTPPVFVAPYPPSWIDGLTDWVERLPIPWWSFYVVLAAAMSGAVALVLWWAGVYASFGFHPMQVFLPSLTAYVLGVTHGLDRAAASSMQRFRPAFRGGDDEFAAAVYRMTTLPGRPTLLITVGLTLASLPFGMAEFSFIQTGGLERVPVLFILIIGSIYLGGIGLFYHSLYQLREISRLYRDHVEVRLARVRPLHALSRVTGLTALGLIVLNYGWYIAQPGLDPNNPVTIIESSFLFLLALITFAWPLWGAHRLLAEAKEQGLADVARRKEAVRLQLHQAVDGGHFDRVDPLHKVLGALEAENTELARVATWPWAPGTLRGLLGAVFLPVVLWLIQFGLGRLLG